MGYSINKYSEHGNVQVSATLTSGLPCDSWIVVWCSALCISSGLAYGGYKFFMKFRPVEAEMFNANSRPDRQIDGRRGMTKLIVAFRNFANARNNKKPHNFQLNVTLFQML